MRSGRLRHQIRFERSTESQNEYNEVVNSWALLATAWAGVEPLRGNERLMAMQVQADADLKIITRYQSALSDLTPKDRVVFGLKVYDIKAVINVNMRNMELQVMVREHL
jgi:SPP1 family predicted phage head-tail adaptor